jgi:glycosyltransferase involved in cell wall biosynthesis
VTVRRLAAGETIANSRQRPTVVVAGDSMYALVETLESVAQSTPVETPVLVLAMEDRLAGLESESHGRELLGLVVSEDAEVPAFNAALQVTMPADIALVMSGTLTGSGWLERLRAAAFSDSTVASATPLSLCMEGGGSLEKTNSWVREAAVALHPRIATIGPYCAYIRRAALELAGPLVDDDESRTLWEALDRLAVRMTSLGLIHVAADDVLVAAPAGLRQSSQPGRGWEPQIGAPHALGSLTTTASPEAAVGETLAHDERGPLSRSLGRARMALEGLSVTIDGRALNAAAGGTQTYIIELILALARMGAAQAQTAQADAAQTNSARAKTLSVRVLVPPDLSARAASALASAPQVELLSYEQALAGVALSDVVHRPQQVFTPDDLALLRLVGERVVIGQQDLVAYHNFSYHPDVEVWRAYRRTTRLALAGADQVIFFSEHARADALVEDLLPAERTHVVGVGAEEIEPSSVTGAPPAGLAGDVPFVVCLGADYAHKNRPFAMRLLGALREAGWRGRLVLAGPHVPFGSSREDEREILRSQPELAEWIVDLGAIEEGGKRWLYEYASALLYPTVYEGFGLLPLEAARAGVPCLFAPQASLGELAGEAATLIPWDASASAAAVLPLLSEGAAREAHVARLRALALPAWSEVAAQLVAVYEYALRESPSGAAPRVWQELDRERHIVRLDQDVSKLKQLAQEYQDAYHSLEARVSTGLPLIDRGGLLTPAQQRGLMRIAGRGRFGALVLSPLGLLGRGQGKSGDRAD